MFTFKMKYQFCIYLTVVTIASSLASEDASSIVAGNNKMVAQLYPLIAKPQQNLIFSPLSLHTILSLVYQGSAGTTEQSLKNVLNNPDKLRTADGYESIMAELNNLPNVTLEIANRVYVKDGYKMKPQFVDVAAKKFAAGAENIDFAQPDAAQTMNAWVEQRTNNKIKNLLQENQLNGQTRMVLINAIYFKGAWASAFDKRNTQSDVFYTSETDTVPCEMMFRHGRYSYKDDDDLKAQVIRLPYKNPDVSMVIVLPHSKTGLADVEKKMATMDLEKLTENMRKEEVDLSLPRFKIKSTINLNDPLIKIGLAEAFSDAANFSELLESSERLQISEVVQKAFIEVNEEGAEAAAATVLGVRNRSGNNLIPKKVVHFRADQSFTYLICGYNKVIFIGSLHQI